jgi:Phage tail assembly chaperone protein
MIRIIYDAETGSVLHNKYFSDNQLALNLSRHGNWRVHPNTGKLPGTITDKFVNLVTMEIETRPHIPNIPGHVRLMRSHYLAASDWTQNSDVPMSTEKRAAWTAYRQALRDLPDNIEGITRIEDIPWPVEPN